MRRDATTVTRSAALLATRRLARRAAGGAVAGLLSFGAAAQPSPPCKSPNWTVLPDMSERWTAIIPQACALADDPALDATARVQLGPAPGDAMAVEVTLPDGRRARRLATSPGKLLLTLEALLALPIEAPARAPVRRVIEPDRAVPTLAPGSPAAANKGSPAVAWGALAGANWVGTPGALVGTLTGFAEVSFGRSEVLLGLRSEPLRWSTAVVDSSFEMETLGAQFGFLRVLSAGSGHRVDAGVTALLATELQSLETDEGEVVANGNDLRVGLLVRAELGSLGPRWLIAFEAGCSPLRLRRPVYLDPALPALPSWSVGLAIGATWRGG